MLLLAVLTYAWNSYSEYQSEQDSITNVENVSKFNEQFSNYDRDDVQGYELITLSNKVADYNNRYASTSAASEGATGTGTYTPITLTITFTKSDILQLAYDGSNCYLFTAITYTQSDTTKLLKNVFTNDSGTGVYDIAVSIEETFGSSSNATRVAKAIGTIFYSDDDIKTYAEKNDVDSTEAKSKVINTSMQKFNTCVSTSKKITSLSDATDKLKVDSELYNAAVKYYEYMMFKTMVFDCTKIEYDDASSRVKTMVFECTGKFAD